jgi:hypothetical protein
LEAIRTMKLNNLVLHCGGAAVEQEQLERVATPESVGRWQPIGHAELAGQVRRGLENAGMKILTEAHALNRGGAQYFGLMQVAIDGHENDDWGTVVGLRNSHDKRFPAALALGSSVFVCDNTAFTGEVVLARRHTTHIRRDLPEVTARAVGRLTDFAGQTERRADSYRKREVGNAEAHDLIVRALDAQAITTTMVPRVLEQWRAPNHPEFKDRNLWSLYNGFTETLKGGLLKLPRRSEALHGVLDLAAKPDSKTLVLQA